MRQIFRFKNKIKFYVVLRSTYVSFLGSRCVAHGTCATCWLPPL